MWSRGRRRANPYLPSASSGRVLASIDPSGAVPVKAQPVEDQTLFAYDLVADAATFLVGKKHVPGVNPRDHPRDGENSSMKVYIGVSKYLGSDAMANLLEVDYDTPEAKERSYFERVLGADYIRPEDFEIYDRKDYPGETFDSQFIKRLLPIPARRLNLDTLDFSEIRSVFFLQNAGSLRSGPDGFIEIVD